MSLLSIAQPPCVAEDFGGEIVALNLDTGYYFSLPGLAGAIWRDLAEGHTTQDIVAGLAAIDPKLGDDAGQFTTALVESGLMREDPDRSATANKPADLECIPLASDGAREITFEPYDDMKDLVMTDPIHDVDEEAGWPTPPRDGS